MKLVSNGNNIHGISDNDSELTWDTTESEMQHAILIARAELFLSKAELMQVQHLNARPYHFE